MEIKGVTVERVLEAVIEATTGRSQVSVATLGDEISVNLSGKNFNFIVEGDACRRVVVSACG